MDASFHEPVNLGNPDERRIVDLAELVKEKTSSIPRPPEGSDMSTARMHYERTHSEINEIVEGYHPFMKESVRDILLQADKDMSQESA